MGHCISKQTNGSSSQKKRDKQKVTKSYLTDDDSTNNIAQSYIINGTISNSNIDAYDSCHSNHNTDSGHSSSNFDHCSIDTSSHH